MDVFVVFFRDYWWILEENRYICNCYLTIVAKASFEENRATWQNKT